MSTNAISPAVDRMGRRHPRLLILMNFALLIFMTLTLLTTTEAPVVLYQAF